MTDTAGKTGRALEGLGIDETEERTYRTLLTQRRATAHEVARLVGLSPRRVQRLLDALERKGLVTRSPERPRRYMAAPPELAVEALIMQRRAVLDRARQAIPQLLEESAAGTASGRREQIVEIISNREVVVRMVTQLHQTVQWEVLGFQRAPMFNPDGHQRSIPPGVRMRSISDLEYLQLPGSVDSLRRVTAMGEEARVFPVLPIKLYIVDRRIALVPFETGDQGGSTLLVRASALLDALCALFEHVWERSTPLVFGSAGELVQQPAATRSRSPAEQLLPLLAAGLNDKAIAHEQAISEKTLARRIAELMRSWDSRTRFQLGWRAAMAAKPDPVER